MANSRDTQSSLFGLPAGAELLVYDTTDSSETIGATPEDSVGTCVLTVEGTGFTGSIIPKGRGWGGAAGSMAFQALGYQNRCTITDVAAGTAITANGIYAFPMDGLEINLDVTVSAGSVKILVNRVRG